MIAQERTASTADVRAVELDIWKGHIWSLARDGEGWRPYDGGTHDHTHPTGGHYHHLHITTRELDESKQMRELISRCP